MKGFTLEGSVCFANVPPGFYVRMEHYDIHPDGTVRWALTITPESKAAPKFTRKRGKK